MNATLVVYESAEWGVGVSIPLSAFFPEKFCQSAAHGVNIQAVTTRDNIVPTQTEQFETGRPSNICSYQYRYESQPTVGRLSLVGNTSTRHTATHNNTR